MCPVKGRGIVCGLCKWLALTNISTKTAAKVLLEEFCIFDISIINLKCLTMKHPLFLGLKPNENKIKMVKKKKKKLHTILLLKWKGLWVLGEKYMVLIITTLHSHLLFSLCQPLSQRWHAKNASKRKMAGQSDAVVSVKRRLRAISLVSSNREPT